MPASPNNFFREHRKLTVLGAVAAVLAVGIFAIFTGKQPPQQQAFAWHKANYASVTYAVGKHQDLATVSDQFNVTPVSLALFNDRNLSIAFPENCYDGDAFYAKWPRQGKFFCNKHLNLARANTLMPGQRLRIPVANGVPADIVKAIAVTQVNPLQARTAILVDAQSKDYQKNLDAAVQFTLAMKQRGSVPAGIFIYNDTDMFEYRNEASNISFRSGIEVAGVDFALRVVSVMDIDQVVLITDRPVSVTQATRGVLYQPVIGYCTSAVCAAPMVALTKQTKGRYV